MRLKHNILNKYKVYQFSKIKENKIFLVGSITEAKDHFFRIESILQIKYKKLVSLCSADGLLNKRKFSSEEWDLLQEIALRKLEQQEAILVLDVNDYIGDQTKEEINFFEKKLKRSVYYLSKLKD